MKALNLTKTILLIIAVVLASLGILVPVIGQGLYVFPIVMLIILFVGSLLTFHANKLVSKIGYLVVLAVVAFMFFVALRAILGTSPDSMVAIGGYISIVPLPLIGLVILFQSVINIK